MTNTEISNNNPEKELIQEKSMSDDKAKQIIKNTSQTKNCFKKTQTNLLMKLHIRYLTILS